MGNSLPEASSPPVSGGSPPPISPGAVVPSSAPPATTFSKVFQALKDLKELVGIVLFFGAGVVWVGGYFATKSQLGELRCLMQAQIDLARSENDFNAVKTEMVNASVLLDALTGRKDTQGTLSPAERQQFFQLEAGLEDLKKRRAAAQEKADRVRADLDHNICATH
jgi:hypothetical protein